MVNSLAGRTKGREDGNGRNNADGRGEAEIFGAKRRKAAAECGTGTEGYERFPRYGFSFELRKNSFGCQKVN